MLEMISLNIMEDDKRISRYILEHFDDVDIKVTNGSEEVYKMTNIKKVKPIIYKIKSNNIKITILYFKCNDIKEKRYYIPKLKQDYTFVELKEYLNENL